MKDLNITVENGVKEIMLRTGDAVPIELPIPVVLAGVLSAPREFVEKRKEKIAKDSAHVVYSKSKLTLSLVVEEQSKRGFTINGALILNPELAQFGINAKHFYSNTDLAYMIKMNKRHFLDKEEHLKILSELNKFKVKITTEIEKLKDERGNSRNVHDRVVENTIPLNFKLSLPLFLGYDSTSFAVDICLDATDGGIRFWLDSVELYELLVDQSNKIFENELKAFSDYVIIEQP